MAHGILFHMGPSAAALVSVVALTGCTLLSLDDLTNATASETATTQAGGGPSSSSMISSSSNGANGTGAQGAGGLDAYAGCVLADNPSIYFRMDSTDDVEPNLGSFLGDGTYKGPNVAAASLISTDYDSLSAKKFQAGGQLAFTTTQFMGGYEAVTLEMWVLIGDALEPEGPERALFSSEPSSSALLLLPRVGDGDDVLTFVVGQTDAGKRSCSASGLWIAEPAPIHIVAVYRRTADTLFDASGMAGDMALYVDGTAASTFGTGAPGVIANAMQDLLIGGDLGSSEPGAVFDEFAAYSHELSSNDIARHYQAGLTGACD